MLHASKDVQLRNSEGSDTYATEPKRDPCWQKGAPSARCCAIRMWLHVGYIHRETNPWGLDARQRDMVVVWRSHPWWLAGLVGRVVLACHHARQLDGRQLDAIDRQIDLSISTARQLDGINMCVL